MPTKSSASVKALRTSPLRRPDEIHRLAALRSYHILDTLPEQAFDNVVQLAARICGAPIAMMVLIDATRQWVKAWTGPLGVNQSLAREVSFCQHAMYLPDGLEVADTLLDPLFRLHPLVVNEPGIRFYAGAPLVTAQGLALGTICILDTVPRRLEEGQRETLRILAREIMAHLELRRAQSQLEEEKHKLEGLLRMANNATEAYYVQGGQHEIFIKQDHKLVRVHTADIRYVEALGDYVNIYSCLERYTVYSTMKELEAKLPTRDFARVHRKYIVRLDRIVAIESDAVIVEAGRSADRIGSLLPVPIGSSYKAALLGRLNLI